MTETTIEGPVQCKTEVLSQDEWGWTARITVNGNSGIIRVGSISALLRNKPRD